MVDQLLTKAWNALENAYAPYSEFAVGACIETRNHKYIIGANIENASYGLTNCAERSALFSAYSQGFRKEDIIRMAVVTNADHLVSPCGACRQVMVELLKEDTAIILANKTQQIIVTIQDLMPLSFSGKDLL